MNGSIEDLEEFIKIRYKVDSLSASVYANHILDYMDKNLNY